jgi:hypothetical protein
MRCSISGRATDLEIPLLVMLFYLSREVAPSRSRGRLVQELSRLAGELRGRQRQVGSLAGAAHLLNNNTGVLRSAQ